MSNMDEQQFIKMEVPLAFAIYLVEDLLPEEIEDATDPDYQQALEDFYYQLKDELSARNKEVRYPGA